VADETRRELERQMLEWERDEHDDPGLPSVPTPPIRTTEQQEAGREVAGNKAHKRQVSAPLADVRAEWPGSSLWTSEVPSS
jgi:hypothetical protein